ncbi:hypothetical protein L226DRAFT_483424 [Lentinus tigrinus ALCF2SS1-7]|uniref:uncharacterized protein n=1 Tax=Lentinus tigrinus ALCF2SS1-7 TaxID=1328758 RepID=UPI001165DD15|nr:hypothetical protein L226DRAFT_483424 [Lentinus tigrinus ALCF2SS1-7]
MASIPPTSAPNPDATATPLPIGIADAHRAKKARTGATGEEHATPDKANELERTQRKEPNRRPPPLIGPQPIRYIAPLPARTSRPQNEMALPIHLYKPDDFNGLPTAVDENPHIGSTRQGEKPELPKLTYTCFADVEFHATHIPDFKMRGNVNEEQLASLDALGTRLLYVVLHGGGQRFLKRAPEKVKEVKDFLQSLSFECHEGAKPELDVIAPIAKNPSDRKRFGQPWTLFLVLGEEEHALRKYLLWQQVFSVHPTLSFSIFESAPGQPWPIMVLTGAEGAVVDSPEAKKQVLAAIKKKLWSNLDYCIYAAGLVAAYWGAAGNMATLARMSTDSLDIKCVRAELSGSEKLVPAYLVVAKPPTTDRGEYQRWSNFFTAPGEYWRELYQLKVNAATVDCKLCKDASHCACDCPLPTTLGWQGPTATDIYQKEQEDLAHAATSTTAPTQQAAELWRTNPKKGERGRKAASPKKKGSQSGRKDSRPIRR